VYFYTNFLKYAYSDIFSTVFVLQASYISTSDLPTVLQTLNLNVRRRELSFVEKVRATRRLHSTSFMLIGVSFSKHQEFLINLITRVVYREDLLPLKILLFFWLPIDWLIDWLIVSQGDWLPLWSATPILSFLILLLILDYL